MWLEAPSLVRNLTFCTVWKLAYGQRQSYGLNWDFEYHIWVLYKCKFTLENKCLFLFLHGFTILWQNKSKYTSLIAGQERHIIIINKHLNNLRSTPFFYLYKYRVCPSSKEENVTLLKKNRKTWKLILYSPPSYMEYQFVQFSLIISVLYQYHHQK